MHFFKIIVTYTTQQCSKLQLIKKIMGSVKKGREFASEFHGNEKIDGEKLIYPAATRNQEPILQVLKSKDGVITPESNIQFDAGLRARDPSWGLRDITDLIKLGEENNLSLIDTIEMPANNKTLIWKKN
ncbi:uncharacterized protein LOC125225589 isoform X2 [Leguminivora glycinivorella]|uniref:uncharacterized protein LOC125225589 isoform X2 n=1 Tax=Leguminivora glycinivorella TaxID=1035111 RepID=UPI00200C8773|nr:uncharacterized protein LOC125225589 isoform X2 [Leguminivora glycinivorella]